MACIIARSSASSLFSLRLRIFRERMMPPFPWERRQSIKCRVDMQGGILIFFNFFSGGENGGGSDIQPIYSPYWYNDARVYHSVRQLSIKSLSIFFYRKNSTQYPTPPMPPEHPLSTRPKFSVMQSTRNSIPVVESAILLD